MRSRAKHRGARLFLVLTTPLVLLASVGAGVLLFRASAPPAHAAELSDLHVQGNQLVNATGAPVQLRGVNRSGSEYACIQGWGIFDGPSDVTSVAAIAGWHANSVRVPVNEDCWLGINGVPAQYGGATYQQAIYNYVQLLHQQGMYAEVSLMWGAPGTQRATYQGPAPDADHTPALWTSIANTFKNDHDVIFGVYGEPHDLSWGCWRDGGSNCGVGFNVAGMQSLVNAIRATGATQPIAVPGIDWANNLSQWLQYKPSDPLNSLVAEFHEYGDNVCSSSSCWNSEELPVLQNVPLLAGEMGESVNGTCSSTFINAFMAWADAHGASYQGWAWDTWGGCGVLINNYDGTPTSGFGQGYRAHLLSFGGGTPTPPSSPPPSSPPPSSPPPSAPQAKLTPDTLSFGNQPLGTESNPHTVTLANTGDAALSLSGISLSGADATDFAESNACPTSLAAGASCAITVTFTPQIAGTKAAALSVADNAGGSPQRAALSGTGGDGKPPIPPEPPSSGGQQFSDGFESGNLAAWGSTSDATGNSLTVQSAAAHSGQFGLTARKALNAGGMAAVEAEMETLQKQVDVRAYVNLTNLTGHGELNLIGLYSQDDNFLGWVVLVANAQTHYAHLFYYTGTYHWFDCGAAPSFTAWHNIEMQDIVSASGNGGFTLWVDGAKRCSASGISTAKQSNAQVECVMVGSDTSERSIGLDVRLDDVVIAQSYIGA